MPMRLSVSLPARDLPQRMKQMKKQMMKIELACPRMYTILSVIIKDIMQQRSPFCREGVMSV
jgi:hypothetical protein